MISTVLSILILQIWNFVSIPIDENWHAVYKVRFSFGLAADNFIWFILYI